MADLSKINGLKTFARQNQNFNIHHADVHDTLAMSGLNWNRLSQKNGVARLKAYQRLLRVDPDEATAQILYQNGMDSAQKITTLSQSRFVSQFGPLLGTDGAAKAEQIYKNAVNIKSRTMHLVANAHALTSPHFRAMAVNHIAAAVPDHFQNLSSYQEIFGSLNYCECQECKSIFGPAAYLVDLLRIIDLAITVPNTTRSNTADNIPAGLTLQDRRPDLAKIPLTCANTNTLVPYLQIVNEILEQTVASGLTRKGTLLDSNVFLSLANAYYPFNLPFNLPLSQIRAYLGAKNIELADVYEVLSTSSTLRIGEARERLHLSLAQLANLNPVTTNVSTNLPPKISKNYGLTITTSSVAGLNRLDTIDPVKVSFMTQTGLSRQQVEELFSHNLSTEEIFDAAGTYTTSGASRWGTTLTLKQTGNTVTGTFTNGGTLSGSLHYVVALGQFVLMGNWKQTGNPDAGNFEFTFAADGKRFTGKWRAGYGQWESTAWNGSRTSATVGIIPHSFFINKPLAVRQYLNLSLNTANQHDEYDQIDNLNYQTLDTINRFVRLSQALGWSYSDLNWTLITLNAPTVDGNGNLTNVTELTDDTFVELAKIKTLVDTYDTPLDLLTCLWFDLKTIGRGTGEYSQAPFDVIFNNPDVLRHIPDAQVYRPKIATGTTSYVNPLYQETPPLVWVINEQTFKDDPPPQVPTTAALQRADTIVSGIPASANDISAVAVAAFGAVPHGVINLTVPNLSVLYRHTMLAKQLGLGVPGYLVLLRLLGLTSSGKINATLGRDDVLLIAKTVAWMRQSGLSIYGIDYICNHTPSVYVDTGYDHANLPSFLASLQPVLKTASLQKDDFAYQEITKEASEAYYAILLQEGYIDNVGLVLKDVNTTPPNFANVGTIDPKVKPPDAAQLKYILSKVTKKQQEQTQQFAEQLGTFFGVKGDVMTALVDGVQAWLNQPHYLEPFVLAPLFTDAASAVTKSDGSVLKLDPAELPKVFKDKKNITLAKPQVTEQAPNAWMIVDGVTKQVYYAYTPDTPVKPTSTIAFSQPLGTGAGGGPPFMKQFGITPLFYDAASAVTKSDGSVLKLDPAKLPAVFSSKANLTLTNPQVTAQAANAWTIVDGATSRVYYAYTPASPVVAASPISFFAAVPEKVSAYIQAVSQYLLLYNGLGLSIAEMTSVFTLPAVYGITTTTPVTLTLTNVRDIFYLKEMVRAFGDQKDGLVKYFAEVRSASPPPNSQVMAHLHTVTGWNAGQCSALCTQLFGGVGNCNTVERVHELKQIFDITKVLGVDVYFLQQLDTLQTLKVDPQTTHYQQHWGTYTTLASNVLQAVKAQTSNAAWPTTYQQLNDPLEEQKRDALLGLAVWLVGEQFVDITSPRELYEYLLIDVEMGGCAEISYIKEALNAAQLYLQRCRLNLERNVVISAADLPEIWWQWLMNYRIWEANREIFLYPENYLEPTLRKNKTTLFKELESTLSQGQVTKQTVEAAYKKYLDGFAELAKLKYVDAYHCTVNNKLRGDVDTLFLFARTQQDPPTFYYIAREAPAVGSGCKGTVDCPDNDGYLWGEWKKIDVTIHAETVTPVYAFNKLFVFWVEVTRSRDKDSAGGSTLTDVAGAYKTIYRATIKYSFFNFSGHWVQPQTLVADHVINAVKGGTDTYYGPFAADLFVPDNPYYQKVAATTVSYNNYNPAEKPNAVPEKICLYYGPLVDALTTTSSKAPPLLNAQTDGPDIYDFKEMIVEANEKWTQMKVADQAGYFAVDHGITLNTELEDAFLLNDTEYYVFEPNPPANTMAPTFKAGFSGNQLAISPFYNALYNNYVDGMKAGGQAIEPVNIVPIQPATQDSFTRLPYITQSQSQTIFNLAKNAANGYLDAQGNVQNIAYATPLMSLKSSLQLTSDIQAVIVRNKFFELGKGTSVLFANAARKNASILPVKNQPGWFLFNNMSETFLVTGRSSSYTTKAPGTGVFPKITQALQINEPWVYVNKNSFITADIDEAASQSVYNLLKSTAIGLVKSNGIVNTGLVKAQDVASLKSQLQLQTMQQAREVKDILLYSGPTGMTYAGSNFYTQDAVENLDFTVERLTTSAVQGLSHKLFTEGIDGLLALRTQQPPQNVTLFFNSLDPGAQITSPPKTACGGQVEFTGPYGIYYWELFFHGPMLVASMLNANQQFRDAETWYQYLFNPTLPPPPPMTATDFETDDIDSVTASTIFSRCTNPALGYINAQGQVTRLAFGLDVQTVMSQLNVTGLTMQQAQEVLNILLNNYLAVPTARYWLFLPFRNHSWQSLKCQLTNCAQIATYNDDPFDPYAIARLRIGAFEKAVVMKYIDNLLDWGDYEFAQYTWETITSATMLYVYAYDLLGPKPQDLGPCEEQFPATFADILARYKGGPGDIPQFLIDMENMVGGGGNAGQAGQAFNDLGAYFCVPENQQFTAYWDRVQDRLYKIRHCLNIKGQKQPLPLFQPPISPMALVKAAAAGNNVLDVVSQLQPNIPNYRFSYMLARAQRVAGTVSQFGGSLLAALEKNDAEALALMHSSQSGVILNMMTTVKQKQIEDLQDQLAGLRQSLQSAQYRQTHYKNLIDKGLNAAEIIDLTLKAAVLPLKAVAIGIHGISIAGYIAPVVFGFSDGDMKIGDAIGAGAAITNTIAEMLNQSATLAALAGQYERRAAEWTFQKELAGYDINQINQQIAGANARIAGSQQDLAVNQKQIEQGDKEEAFLKSKFTNQELYQWMISRISTIYFQAYRLALDIALAAQAAYHFELDRDDQYVTYGYWDSLHKGLLAGEGLTLSLNQLEQAYVENNTRRLEIEKTISVRQHFPEAFISFKWGNLYGDDSAKPGKLQFTLSEQLFDYDYPGHYCRKIKSIAISIPALIGPYENINATLTQNSNSVVLKPDASAVEYLIYQTTPQLIKKTSKALGTAPAEPAAGTLRQNWVPNQEIALSKGVDDTGLFVLDFRDERYLPFEGTGAVSTWTLEMPPETNRINFDSISDVIIKVQYTARDGGSTFAGDVKALYNNYTSDSQYENLNAKSFDLKQAFASVWFKMFNTAPVSNLQSITFPVTDNVVLPNLGSVKLHAVLVQLEVTGVSGPVTVSGTTNSHDAFLSLTVGQEGQAPSSPISIDVTNNFGELKASDLTSLTTWEGSKTRWSFRFDVNTMNTATKAALLKSGELDPAKLINVALVIVYSAKPF